MKTRIITVTMVLFWTLFLAAGSATSVSKETGKASSHENEMEPLKRMENGMVFRIK